VDTTGGKIAFRLAHHTQPFFHIRVIGIHHRSTPNRRGSIILNGKGNLALPFIIKPDGTGYSINVKRICHGFSLFPLINKNLYLSVLRLF
jgi:hypothetical protein